MQSRFAMFLSRTQILRVVMYLFLATTYNVSLIRAQNRPANTIRPSARPAALPPGYRSGLVNRIRTWIPAAPATDTGWVTATTRTAVEVRMQTQYFDGLGRLLQTVGRQHSPGGKDVVSPALYDAFGREQFSYLPYAQQTGISNGAFKMTPFPAQSAYYKDRALSPGVGSDSIYYTQTRYDASPLNRVTHAWAPGNAWAKEGGSRPVMQRYQVNTVADSVRCWTMPVTGQIPVSVRIYSAGTLSKDVVISEAGVQRITYHDKAGRIVLYRSQLAANPGTGHMGWLSTYYVYDDAGMLRAVIPPKAVDLIKSNWTVPEVAATELCFLYRYDGELRTIVQKVPGADSIEMVYDKRGRIVARRDGVMKAMGQWYAISYDQLNRERKTALINLPDSRAQLQMRVDQLIPGSQDILSLVAATQTRILTNTFYDDYNFPGKQSYLVADINKVKAGGNPYPVLLPSVASQMTKGLMTGRSVRVEATEQFITTTFYYDAKGRVTQVLANNMAGGNDVITTLYDFSGKILSTYQRHTNPRSVLTPQTTILTTFAYDALGRVDSIGKRINDDPATQHTIAVNVYDENGRLRTKRLEVTSTNEQLETLQYVYNIRGWLKSVNGTFVNTSGSTSNWFGQEYSYEYGFDSSEYTGNIAGIKWKTATDGIVRAYGFDYDRADQLNYADFVQQQAGTTTWTNDKADFSVSGLTYDPGGNILSMKQRGVSGMAVRTIDSLKYGYFPGSNRLSYVTDKRNDPATQLGDFKEMDNREVQDYWYDPNGNISRDNNKAIDTILYNHQQLPAILLAKGKKASIHYLYAAGKGELLAKMVADTSITPHRSRITHYINGFQYEQDTLQFIAQEEGRIRPVYKTGKPVVYVFDYFLKDNLGNVRMVLSTEKDTVVYKATMETASAAREATLFSNIAETRARKPVGYPDGIIGSTDGYVARLNAINGQKIGPSLVLRVMAGDSLMIGVNAFHKKGPATPINIRPEAMITALLDAFNSKLPGSQVHGITDASLSSFPFGTAAHKQLQDQLPRNDMPDRLPAYLCFAGFDDQLNLVSRNTGVRQVQPETDIVQTLVAPPMRIYKSGYVYIYTSNESAQDVYFDNLTVTHITGPLLEETHYYPFGLTMAAISYPALKGPQYPENRKRYNGIELNTALGLNEYDAFYRTLDPQTGRWKQIDPKIDKMEAWSPYVSNFNNPIRYSDFLGDKPEPDPGQGILKTMFQVFNVMVRQLNNYMSQNRKENMAVIRGAVNQGVENFKGRIATGTTTPQLIYNAFRQDPLGAVTGLGGLELKVAVTTTKELALTSNVGSGGAKVAEGIEVGVKMSGKLDGAGRAAKYSESWESASLKDAIAKFAPGAEGVPSEAGQKTLYLNKETGVQIVYDDLGDYFRIQDTKIKGERVYLDWNGTLPNNKIVNGKQMGRSKVEYNQITHFKNTDK